MSFLRCKPCVFVIGDEYEIFIHNQRKQNMYGEDGIYEYAYIGEFDETQFNTLLAKYIQ